MNRLDSCKPTGARARCHSWRGRTCTLTENSASACRRKYWFACRRINKQGKTVIAAVSHPKQTFLDEQLRQEIDDRLSFRHPGSEHPIEVAVGTTLSADRESRSFRFKRRRPSCLVGQQAGN